MKSKMDKNSFGGFIEAQTLANALQFYSKYSRQIGSFIHTANIMFKSVSEMNSSHKEVFIKAIEYDRIQGMKSKKWPSTVKVLIKQFIRERSRREIVKAHTTNKTQK